MKANGIRRLSSSTNVVDCRDVVGDYLKSIGHQRTTINTAIVYVRVERGITVAAGPTPESVSANAVNPQPVGTAERSANT